MEAIIVVVLKKRERKLAAQETSLDTAQTLGQPTPPSWTWFIENPRPPSTNR